MGKVPYSNLLAGVLLALSLVVALSSCGGGSSELTTPLPNGGNNNGSNGNNGGNNGSDDPTINLPGGGQGHPFPFMPAITVPPVESFKDASAASDDLQTKWLKNCFEPTQTFTGANGVYQNSSLLNWAEQIFQGVNAERVKMGLKPVKRNVHMDELSQSMARDMALRNYFSHYTPDGLSPWDRYEAVLIPYYDRAGEISAKGQENVAEVVAGWMASPGHRAIISIPELTHGGIGVYFDDSDYTQPVHIVMDFAQFPKVDPEVAVWYQRGDVFRK